MATPFKSGTEFLVNTTTVSTQGGPSIAAFSDGRFVVAWADASMTGGDTSSYAVRAQLFHADGSLSGPEFLVNSTVIGSQAEPVVTTFADGRFMVAWDDFSSSGTDTSEFCVRAQMYLADGSALGSEFMANTTVAKTQALPTIAAFADGKFVMAWVDNSLTGRDKSGYAVRAQIFNADGTQSGSEFQINTTVKNNQYEPTLTVLSDGRFVAIWSDSGQTGGDTAGYAIRGQIFNANGSRSGIEFQVNTTEADDQWNPTVTALANGKFAVAWTDQSQTGGDTSFDAIRAQVFNADGTASGAELLVNTAVSSGQREPTITTLADGRFVVAWVDPSQSVFGSRHYDIKAQVFDPDGTPSGSEFLVNTTSVGYQIEPTITVLADGRFGVAWTGGGWSLGEYDIHGQILDPRVAAVQLNGTAMADDYVGTIFGDQMHGANGDDSLAGARGDDFLSGEFGDDSLAGGGGNDLINGDDGNDSLGGCAGSDTLDGGIGADKLHGGGLDDLLFGGAGDDSLYGGTENDTLNGGDGSDRLFGGAGRDVFVFAQTLGGGVARVKDFTDGEDKIDLSAFGFANAWTAKASFSAVGTDLVILIGSATMIIENTQLSQITFADLIL